MQILHIKPHVTSFRHRKVISKNRRLFIGSFRKGFTFTEILFAVMLLGIGFIMLAGLFPVGIQQTQSAVDDTAAATVAANAAKLISQVCNSADLPPLPLNYGLELISPGKPKQPQTMHPAWRKVSQHMINAQDPRYAWVPYYLRRPGENFAQLIIVVLRARNYTNYNQNDLTLLPPTSEYAKATLQPRIVIIDQLEKDNGSGVYRAKLRAEKNDSNDLKFVAEGAFLVIASGSDNRPNPNNDANIELARLAAGRIYRLGKQLEPLTGLPTNTGEWELLPGYEPLSDTEALVKARNPQGAIGYIIGRGYRDPGNSTPDAEYDGAAQDLAVFSTTIMLK
jgi:hypothetical protein